MPPSGSGEEWAAIDDWWERFARNRHFLLADSDVNRLEAGSEARNWECVDDLWNAFEANTELALSARHVRDLGDGATNAWTGVDGFWEGRGDRRRRGLSELRKLLRALDTVWADGASRFDADPLTANWHPESEYEGPLRTSVDEEDWSQWLAHLLRSSAGPFVRALFEVPDRSPDAVRREVVFSNERSTRRIDVLVEYEDTAVSIEVKNGDTNFEKTPETAGFIERGDKRDWSHVLLVRKSDLPNLRRTFGADLYRSGESRLAIRSKRSTDIDVRYWRDVSRSLRRTLLAGRESDSHWEASAYLFITLVEQRVLELRSAAFTDPAGATAPETMAPDGLHRLAVAEPEAAIEYVRSVLPEDYDHE